MNNHSFQIYILYAWKLRFKILTLLYIFIMKRKIINRK